MAMKACRQPTISTRKAKGTVAAMFPTVPMEKTMPVRVAKVVGLNQAVSSFSVPMRLQAMPIPSRMRPRRPMAKESAHAKISAPVMPNRDNPVIIRRGPIRSRRMLMGICVMAKA